MIAQDSLLGSVVVFLSAAVITVPLAKRLRLGAVIGYLVAGLLIGPHGLGLIGDPDRIAHFSEIGVVLLLFIIGLELSLSRLWKMRKLVFGFGSAQVVFTGLLIGSVAFLGFGQSPAASVLLGAGLALSSTAFGLQSLAESRELHAAHGKLAFAILLFQDMAAIPLIAIVPLIAPQSVTGNEGTTAIQILKLLGSLGVVIIAGRYLMRPVFKIVARTGLAEMSTATALLVVMGTAWLMSQAGVSMALGAFLAGLLLAESEYKHELESQIEPFKGLLLALFFMSVGMSADLTLLVESPLVIVGLTVLLILIKMPVLMLIGQFLEGVDKDSALKLGLVLAAGGEFAFVVFQQGRIAGLFSAHDHDILVLTITLSMALIPVLMLAQSKIRRRRAVAEQEVPSPYKDIDADAPRVVIAGMGRVGQIIARILRAQNIPFIALDTSVETIELIRSFEGVPVFYGDPLRPEILKAAKVGSAEYFMIATDDQDVSVQTAQLVRRLYPHIKIIARARNRHHAHRLADEGVEAFRETFHSSLEMSRSALQGLGLTRTEADFRLRQFAEHDEKVLETQRTIRDDVAKVLQNTHEARLELTKLFESDTHSDSSKKRGRWRSKVSVHRTP